MEDNRLTLREIRREMGLTVLEMSNFLDMGFDYYRNRERMLVNCYVDDALAILAFSGLSFEDVIWNDKQLKDRNNKNKQEEN